MKETVYRCNKCNELITDTRHKITAMNEQGNVTKYGALLEDIDLCEECMAAIALSILDFIGDEEAKTEPDEQQPDTEEVSTELEEPANRQQEGQEHMPEDKNTYQCSKVMKTCRYAERIGAKTKLYCNYAVLAGHSRGCDPEQCDKYENAVRKRGRKPKKVTEA